MYKYLIVSLVFSHLGFWSGNLFLIAPFPDLCLLVPFCNTLFVATQLWFDLCENRKSSRIFYDFLRNIINYYGHKRPKQKEVLSKNKKNIKLFQLIFSVFKAKKNLCILHGQVFLSRAMNVNGPYFFFLLEGRLMKMAVALHSQQFFM